MDPLSQALLGAGLAQSFARKKTLKIATICGALGGMAPDLDILIRSSEDQLLFLEYHRHFTHALPFVPIGGLIVAAFLYLFLKKEASFKHVWLFTTLGYATHGLLDACTSYGTRLYWPFSDERVGWNVVSIIDPLFTVPFAVFATLCVVKKSVLLGRVGLAVALAYLALGFAQHERVKEYMTEVAQKRGHTIERILLNPTFANQILWRSVYQSGGYYYIDAVRTFYGSDITMKEGMKVKVVDVDTVFPELPTDSQQRKDIKRFAYFSQGYIYQHPDYEYVLADLRYGTLPYDNKSMWGVGVDIKNKNPQSHAQMYNLRRIEPEHRMKLWNMIRGDME